MNQTTPSFISRARSLGGFSLIETMVAVVLVSVVGILLAQLIQKNTLNLVWSNQTRKASTLADMVIEKYNYLSTVNFDSLEQFNKVKIPVSNFFASADNQGYDGMLITTTVDPAASDGNRKLSVVVSWGSGGPRQQFRVDKYLSPSTGQKGGAPVYVTVLDNAGQGVPGFIVKADHHFDIAYVNPYGTNEVIAYTDNDGKAILYNVSTAQNHQPMRIVAGKPGSDATVSKTDPNYEQGYVYPPNLPWNPKTITVSQTDLNEVTYDFRQGDFAPLGSISGKLTNINGPVDQMELSLRGCATIPGNIAVNGSWSVWTNIAGGYEFNNICPGLAAKIVVLGIKGSTPNFPPSYHAFKQGYMGFGGNGTDPWDYLFTLPTSAPNLTDFNVAVRPLGSMTITAFDSFSAPLKDVTVSHRVPQIAHGDRGYIWTGTTDINGQIKRWNVCPQTTEDVVFNANRAPTTGCDGYVLKDYVQNCSANQDNAINLPMKGAASVSGRLLKQSDSTPLKGMEMSVTRVDGNIATQTIGNDGVFNFCGISTETPEWPNITFTFYDASGRRIPATLTGTVYDQYYPSQRVSGDIVAPTGDTYVHNVACNADPSPTNSVSDKIVTNSLGQFGPACFYFRYAGSATGTATGGPQAYSVGALMVNVDAMGSATLQLQSTYYSYTPVGFAVAKNVTTDLPMPSKLLKYKVQGRLTDGITGIGLAGITFNPCYFNTSCAQNSTTVTTDANGYYGPALSMVNDRSTTKPGFLNSRIPAGLVATNTGFAYQSGDNKTHIPTVATPHIPIQIDHVLPRKGGGM